jgi:hypothetical protein
MSSECPECRQERAWKGLLEPECRNEQCALYKKPANYKTDRDLLAMYLDDGGWHTEASNVREGIDLESYENELKLIKWMRRHAL